MRRDISKNAQNNTLDPNPNANPNPDPDPDPTHINFVPKNQAFFVGKS